MNNPKLIQSITEMLDNAEANLRSARQLLLELNDRLVPNQVDEEPSKAHANLPGSDYMGSETMEDGNRIIEGRFDGQNMIGPDKKSYPVPANYASKSKLVPGDILKLTIMPDGSFIYKQIGPIPRKRIIGSLCYENGQYKVVAEGKSYNVLLASITYFKAEIGDKLALIVPELEESEWGAIENVIVDRELKGDHPLSKIDLQIDSLD